MTGSPPPLPHLAVPCSLHAPQERRPCARCGDFFCIECAYPRELCTRCTHADVPLAKKGRAIAVLAAATMCVGLTLAGLAIHREGWLGVPTRVVRLGLELGMCIGVARGSIPARFFYVILMGGAGAFAMLDGPWPLGAFYLSCTAQLFTRASRTYFRAPELATLRT